MHLIAERSFDLAGFRLDGVELTVGECDANHVSRNERSGVPAELLVHHLAATFMSVLTWWMENRSSLPPSEVDALYRALVLPTLRQIG